MVVLAVRRHPGVRGRLPDPYPGLGNWKGILPGYENGWTGANEWQKEMDKADARFGPIFAKYAAMPVEEVARTRRR